MNYKCEGITTKARTCKRPATHHMTQANGVCNAHFCAQHARGNGVMKALLPYPWTFDHVEVYS